MANSAKLGIIAGGGRLPFLLIETCKKEQRPFFVLALEESSNALAFADVPHSVVRLGAIGEALEQLRNAGVKELVMAGAVKRPSLFSLKPDAAGAKLLARMGTAFFGGDDAILKATVGFLEDEGFSVVGADTILGGLLTPKGALGKTKPSRQAETDIKIGIKAAKLLGERDIGQAVIVENETVTGEEDEHGTAALIARCAAQKSKPSGVLVKAKKPQQESRVDLPSIGPDTIDQLHAAGLSGVALEADGSLILDKEKVIEKADALGIFVVGVTHE